MQAIYACKLFQAPGLNMSVGTLQFPKRIHRYGQTRPSYFYVIEATKPATQDTFSSYLEETISAARNKKMVFTEKSFQPLAGRTDCQARFQYLLRRRYGNIIQRWGLTTTDPLGTSSERAAIGGLTLQETAPQNLIRALGHSELNVSRNGTSQKKGN